MGRLVSVRLYWSNEMETKVVSKTVKYGKQHWRINADGSWEVLMFGSFGPNQVGLCHRWAGINTEKVPQEVMETV